MLLCSRNGTTFTQRMLFANLSSLFEHCDATAVLHSYGRIIQCSVKMFVNMKECAQSSIYCFVICDESILFHQNNDNEDLYFISFVWNAKLDKASHLNSFYINKNQNYFFRLITQKHHKWLEILWTFIDWKLSIEFETITLKF